MVDWADSSDSPTLNIYITASALLRAQPGCWGKAREKHPRLQPGRGWGIKEMEFAASRGWTGGQHCCQGPSHGLPTSIKAPEAQAT